MRQFLEVSPFLTSGDTGLGFFQLKIGTPLTRAPMNVYTNFNFCKFFFLFRVTSPYGTYGRARSEKHISLATHFCSDTAV